MPYGKREEWNSKLREERSAESEIQDIVRRLRLMRKLEKGHIQKSKEIANQRKKLEVKLIKPHETLKTIKKEVV